jgi:hypothetical protein
MSLSAEPSMKDIVRHLQSLDSRLTSLQQEILSQVSDSRHSASLAKLALESELRIQEQLKEDTKSMETFNRLLAMQVALWVFVLVLLFGWWTKLNRRIF